jgi:hypothetical protein
MNARSVAGSVRESVAEARTKAGLIAAHSYEVLSVGAQTLQECREVMRDARREATEVAVRAREQMTRTLKEGASRIGGKLSRIATPTHREMADMRKEEIKAKKRRKREEQSAAADDSGSPSSESGATDAGSDADSRD